MLNPSKIQRMASGMDHIRSLRKTVAGCTNDRAEVLYCLGVRATDEQLQRLFDGYDDPA